MNQQDNDSSQILSGTVPGKYPFFIVLIAVLAIGCFVAILGFPGPMFVYKNVTAIPFALAVFIAVLVCPRNWYLWPAVVVAPLGVRCGLMMLESLFTQASETPTLFIGQLLLKEMYFTIPAIVFALLLAWGIHALKGKVIRSKSRVQNEEC